jgi:hypothetical protein
MKIIDAHLHINFNGLNKTNLKKYLDDNKIDVCWLMSWEENNSINYEYEYLKPENIYEVYEKYPDRVFPMYAPDITNDDFEQKFLYWYKKGFKGFAELKCNVNWSHNNIEKMFKVLQKYKAPLNFHMENSEYRLKKMKINFINKILDSKIIKFYFNKFMKDVYNNKKINNKYCYYFPGYLLNFYKLEQKLKQYPECVVIGHGPFLWNNISAHISEWKYPKNKIKDKGILCKLLSEYKNFYVDISGMSGYNAIDRDKDFTKKFLEKFSDKILY